MVAKRTLLSKKWSGYVLNVCSNNRLNKGCVLAVLMMVSGCSHDPVKVQVKELRARPVVTKGVHVVKAGDSLYSISWLYNRDIHDIARVNNINPPYTIYSGQKISLAKKAPRQTRVSVTRESVSPKAYSSTSSAMVKKTPVKKEAKIVQSKGWSWPAAGAVIEPFSLSGQINKGIDIRGKLGDSVRAAAAGDVVYSGADLGGYGRLIIIKHNSSYLSAYAHNRELFVREGDSVKAGQKIAEIGSTGTTEPKLHFEIRRNGKPVDPLGYLPRR